MFIAFAAVICNLIIGVVYGGISGYFGGAVDNVMMRIIEIINGIPYLIVVILLMMILPPGLMTIVVAYATTGWTGMARLVRGAGHQPESRNLWWQRRPSAQTLPG